MPSFIPHHPAPRYSAAELIFCQLLNDLTAANLRLGLLRRSGLAPHQLAHVRELARSLTGVAATVAAARADGVEADVPTIPLAPHRRPSFPDVHPRRKGYGNHLSD